MIAKSKPHGFSDLQHLGQTVIGKTSYQVYRIPANPDCGIVARFGLVGPKGSTYYVTDYGEHYKLNSVCLGGGVSWQAAPRPLRGLERKHLALFYDRLDLTPKHVDCDCMSCRPWTY